MSQNSLLTVKTCAGLSIDKKKKESKSGNQICDLYGYELHINKIHVT